MKKLLLVLVLLCGMQVAFADDDAVNVKIKIRGSTADNSYFLCIPSVGCLSILAAQKGKIYPIMHDIEMGGLYIANADDSLRVTPQGRPASCNVTAKTSQTLTISGSLGKGRDGAIVVNGLRCSVG